ncbi:MAG: ornithine cyclodeaminase family protein [Alicyclobacillus shizuokensis]|nr:ornithine cyclodeaminase family protein [Alicyclobacillus shizuokensis]
MAYRTLTDWDVDDGLSMREAVQIIERAFVERAKGTFVSPPRFRVDGGKGALVFTAGGAIGSEKLIGFRVYDTFPGEHPDRTQLVAVFSAETGALQGIVLGERVGIMRTGAIGGVAVKHMARPDAATLAILGTGKQARAQLEAAVAVRDFQTVKVYSPKAEHRRRFIETMEPKIAADLFAVESARACVDGADVVICATNSSSPVLEAEWVKEGAHINTVGPKYVGAHEIPIELIQRNGVLATDSLEQLQAYPKPHVATQVSQTPDIIDLADIVAGKTAGRKSVRDITVFFSVGLAGTEVVLAGEVLGRTGE